VALRLARSPDRAPPEELLCESVWDLAADLEDLAGLARRTCARIDGALEELEPHAGRGSEAVDELVRLRRRLAMLRDQLLTDRELAPAALLTEALVDRLAAGKHEAVEALRTLRSFVAAAVTATDWQSPSFGHSVAPQAGRFAGRVTEHRDDYRRDRHADAAWFERAFVHEYVDADVPVRGLMTGCGMSAFTTILGWLLLEVRPEGPVLLGRRSYHECRDLVLRAFPGRVVEVDEGDPRAVVEAMAPRRPGAVFLDSLCNATGMDLPDVAGVARALAAGRTGGEPSLLVLDNTGRSCSFQPFLLPEVASGVVRLVVHESLTKYAQFGLDRVAAGMILVSAGDGEALDGFREHLGTNAGDQAPYLVPEPDRAALERRLRRLGRNAEALASHVGEVASREPEAITVRAVHPALAEHRGHGVATELWFRGGCLELDFGPGTQSADRSRFASRLLEDARRRSVPLVAGASFGFDVTRVYVTAADAAAGTPFVRIAAGTEHRLGLERLKAVLEACVVG
jgi:cystathionine beta-lyase/cystathionine gamma-synthase